MTNPNDNVTTTDPVEIANILNKHFASIATCPTQINSTSFTPSSTPKAPTMPDILINRQIVLKTLLSLNTNTATGPDKIPNILFKKCAHQLAHPLSKLFKQSLNTGEFPQSWKSASVTPIFKNGLKLDPNSYRPISLLPCISKIFEIIVNDQLMTHLETNKLLSPYQFGFRRNRSTCDLLTILSQLWTNALDNMHEIIVITLDIIKAFDKVWHERLLYKLSTFGIEGKLYNWLNSYLSSRSQFVTINGYSSQSYPITAGVPQGSVLGPTLFLLFINDLPSACANPIYLFADDSTLFKIIKKSDSIELYRQSIQQDLNALENWATVNRAGFNTKKCEAFLISRKTSPTPVPLFTINNAVVPNVDKIKLLGLHIDSKLLFTEHITNLAISASRALGSLIRSGRYLNIRLRAMLYKTLVRSRLEYASPIWGSSSQKYLIELDKVQNRALKFLNIQNPLKYNIPALNVRRITGSVLLYHKFYFKPFDRLDPLFTPAVVRSTARSCNVNHNFLVVIPKSRTEHHRSSFVPSISRLWNSIPSHVASTIEKPNFRSTYYHFLLLKHC
jgi:hypothetical protein